MHRKAAGQLVDVSYTKEIKKEDRSVEQMHNCSLSGCKPGPRWVRPHRASEMYDIGLTKLFQLIKDGRVESRKIDGMRLISVVSLETLGQ
jgi:hypothetical protein